MPKQSKNILYSRVLWANLLGPVFLYVTLKFGIELDENNRTQIILFVMGAVNIMLRTITTKAVHLYAPLSPRRKRRRRKPKTIPTAGVK